jgi:hypothetical protein
VAGREGKRGECQTGLGLVWRETGAVRNARPSRGQAAAHPEEGEVGRTNAESPFLKLTSTRIRASLAFSVHF